MRFTGNKTLSDHEIKLNMTPMIDIVFQLLVFFVMTFKIVAHEGDFKVRMPLASETPPEDIMEPVPTLITVKLNAGDNGNIAGIDVSDGMEDQSFSDTDMYQQLTDFVERVQATGNDPENPNDTEVEFDIDYKLKYQYTVRAIGSVSGKILPDGTTKVLVEKIKFKDNSQPN